jgi:hypothetical protein
MAIDNELLPAKKVYVFGTGKTLPGYADPNQAVTGPDRTMPKHWSSGIK